MYKPTVLTLSPEPPDTMLRMFENSNIAVDSLGLSRTRGALCGRSILERKLRDLDPHVVHTQGVRADILACKCRIRKAVSTIRNYPYYDYPMKFGHVKGRIMAARHITALRKIPHVIACSKTIACIFRERQNIGIDYIQNGVDTAVYRTISKEQKNDLRSKLRIPAGKKIFVSVGSIIPRKDPLTLIKAFNEINGKNDALLVMAGDGPLLDDCRALARGKAISLVGNVSNVQDYLYAADYFVSSSLAEGLPNTVLEALAARLPVILSDIPSHLEIVKDTVFSKFVFGTNDVGALSSAMDAMKNEFRDEYGTAGFKIADGSFSARGMSRKYQDLYKRITGIS